MAAHNAAPYLRQAIESILRQSFRDFEFILVDDASTDATAEIAASYDDPRLTLITAPRNLGAVEARNIGFARARGAYLAIQDADDISHPTRLARQVEHLDRHPGDVLLATDIRQMHLDGEMVQPRTGGTATPLLLEWMMHVGNPLAFPSTMMRMSALRKLPVFLREERRYAEDYDLYVRLLAHGGLARLPLPLLIYRIHPDSCSALNSNRMIEQTGRVLAELWAGDELKIDDPDAAANLVAQHLAAVQPAESSAVLRAVRDTLYRLIDGFIDHHPQCTPEERDAVMLHAGRTWEYLVQASLRSGSITWPSVPSFRTGAQTRLRSRDLVGAALQGMIPRRIVEFLRRRRRRPLAAELQTAPAGGPPGKPMAPPVLFVTVVLEGDAAGDAGHGAALVVDAQQIFDPYGLRPAYLLDRHVAGQAPVCLALRTVYEADGCGIGAWWSGSGGSPDTGAELSSGTRADLLPETGFGSASPGADAVDALSARAVRIPPAAAVIRASLEAIEAGLGIAAAFATAEALSAMHGIPELPEAARALIGIPVSAGIVVPFAAVPDRVSGPGMAHSEGPLGGFLNRDDLTRSVSLLPNHIASEPEILLIRSLLARGERRFFVRLHLRQGDLESAAALARLRRVCTWFFEDLGGLPGDARTLMRDRRRRPREMAAA